MIGKNIAHYKILDKLGEGSMGVVYREHDTKFQNRPRMFFMSGCDFDPESIRGAVFWRDSKYRRYR